MRMKLLVRCRICSICHARAGGVLHRAGHDDEALHDRRTATYDPNDGRRGR